MMNTRVLLDQKWFAVAGTPDAGMPFLFRATPQHGNRRADSSLRSQPEGGRALSGPPAGTLDATHTPQRVTRTQPSGHYVLGRHSLVRRPTVGIEQEEAVRAFLTELEADHWDDALIERTLDRMALDARYHVYAWERPLTGHDEIRTE